MIQLIDNQLIVSFIIHHLLFIIHYILQKYDKMLITHKKNCGTIKTQMTQLLVHLHWFLEGLRAKYEQIFQKTMQIRQKLRHLCFNCILI
jgi:hypothetical protein